MAEIDAVSGSATPDNLGHYDVIVVGGGPAGLSAALLLGRSLRTVLVVDDGAPRNANATNLHGYLARDGTTVDGFLATGREELARYGGELVTDRVAGVAAGIKGDFAVRLAGGSSVTARRLLVTTGLVDHLPDVPGLAERWGRDVLYCPYCHGYEVRDTPLGVLATEPVDVRKALLVRQWSADVALFLHTLDVDAVPAEDWERLAAVDIAVIAGPVAALVVEAGRLSGLRLASGHHFALSAIFVTARPVYRDHLLTALGAATEDSPGGVRVTTDPTGLTSVRGVWAAGNVADNGHQIIDAAASGSRAAQAINADLVFDDVDRAVSRRATGGARPAPTFLTPRERDRHGL